MPIDPPRMGTLQLLVETIQQMSAAAEPDIRLSRTPRGWEGLGLGDNMFAAAQIRRTAEYELFKNPATGDPSDIYPHTVARPEEGSDAEIFLWLIDQNQRIVQDYITVRGIQNSFIQFKDPDVAVMFKLRWF